jgi:hypothetical protein
MVGGKTEERAVGAGFSFENYKMNRLRYIAITLVERFSFASIKKEAHQSNTSRHRSNH